MAEVTVGEIAAFLQVEWAGDRGDTKIRRVSSLAAAAEDSLVFARDAASVEEAVVSRAGLILVPSSLPSGIPFRSSGDRRTLRVKDPRLAFARVYGRWFDRRGGAGVHATAVIEDGVEVGVGCEIGPGAYLQAGVMLGQGCVIGARTVVLGGTTLGDRVRVQAGTVLGSDGFGYVRGSEGYLGFPQIGTLWVGDEVEIGANCTIDRGALGETRIGRGTKIDNLVHIAHNCRIGEDVIVAAQTGIAGSTVVEDGAILGGQVGLAEHVTIGAGVILGAQAGVPTGKKIRGAGEVFWGTPARPIKEYLKDLARLKRR